MLAGPHLGLVFLIFSVTVEGILTLRCVASVIDTMVILYSVPKQGLLINLFRQLFRSDNTQKEVL